MQRHALAAIAAFVIVTEDADLPRSHPEITVENSRFA
jgi:hypothetical protein